MTPLGAPVCEVATVAKRDLKAGEVLDGVGGFMTYGVIENADVFAADGLLPMGVSGGSRLAPRRVQGLADRDMPTSRYPTDGCATGCAPSRSSACRRFAGPASPVDCRRARAIVTR